MNTPAFPKVPEFMLDTVVLKVPYPQFRVTKPENFSPRLNMQITAAQVPNPYIKFSLNPRKDDPYSPRLTVHRRIVDGVLSYDLHIEFSVPKLLFDQNIQELKGSDFDAVLRKLQFRLGRMGVQIDEGSLRSALVVRAHFGKNILLKNITAQDAISELSKADLGKRKDINTRHYANAGDALYFYAASGNIVFYDKIKEMGTSNRRGVEKDKSRREKTLPKPEGELLRFEVRYAKQQTLNSVLSKITGGQLFEARFEAVFQEALWKKVIISAWREIVDTPANQLALKMNVSAYDVFSAIAAGRDRTKKGAHSLKDALAGACLAILIKEGGIRKIRTKIEKGWTPKSWSRLSPKLKASASAMQQLPPARAIAEVQAALEAFERLDWNPHVGCLPEPNKIQ